MIPKPFVYYGSTIEEALRGYNELMPVMLADFEKSNGPGTVQLINVIPVGIQFCAIATIWQDKAKLEALAASKKITESGSELLNQLSDRLTQVLNAEGCDHEYESGIDGLGYEKIICKKCGTPLE